MLAEKLSHHRYFVGVTLIVILLCLIKIPSLTIPYYWDEAWPYSVAIHTFYDNGLVFLPDSIDPEVSRGHPVFFHFLAGVWMKIFGTGLFSGHSFALSISVTLLYFVYFFCKSFFSEKIGFISVLLLATQGIFIANAAFRMPEVLMALWAMVCYYFYYKENRVLYIIFATAMLLTKESGIVLIAALSFSVLIDWLRKDVSLKVALKNVLYICIPVFIAFIYFLIQRIQFGWFFFPFHMSVISTGSELFTEKLPNTAAALFIYLGKNGLTFMALGSLLFLVIRKKEFTVNEKKILPSQLYFIVLFIVFSAMNFFIPRYLLTVYPSLIIICVVLLDKSFSQYRLIYPLMIVGLTCTFIYYAFFNVKRTELGYLDSVRTHQEVVKYCEESFLKDTYIFTHFVMRIDITEKYAGYLAGNDFENVQYEADNKTQIWIVSSDELDQAFYDRFKAEHNPTLLKRFQNGKAWSEIYRLK